MKLFKDRCYNGGTKHNFQARYSEEPREVTKLSGTLTTEQIKALMTTQVYVHDVCTWCGKITK